jgi:hypothetical protein
MLTGCGIGQHGEAESKALTKSRDEVIAAAKEIRADSRHGSQPNQSFSGNYGQCGGKGYVQYFLETEWTTPNGDQDDLRIFNYIIKILKDAGWKDTETPSPRVRKMRRGHVAIGISVKPGAMWIAGEMGGACFNVGDAAGDFLNKRIDHLS